MGVADPGKNGELWCLEVRGQGGSEMQETSVMSVVGWLEQLRAATPHTDTFPDFLWQDEEKSLEGDAGAGGSCFISHTGDSSSQLASAPLLSSPPLFLFSPHPCLSPLSP